MVTITDKELNYLHNTDFLLTKNSISTKINTLLSSTEKEIRKTIRENQYTFPQGVLAKNGKISRGENYQNLPFFVLDYPRCFKGNDIFAWRTLFWWGNFFSNTIHLQGTYLETCRKDLAKNAALLKGHDYYICINSSPWEYDYNKNNYKKIDDLSEQELITLINEKKFLKISNKIEIEKWEKLPGVVSGKFKELMSLLLPSFL